VLPILNPELAIGVTMFALVEVVNEPSDVHEVPFVERMTLTAAPDASYPIAVNVGGVAELNLVDPVSPTSAGIIT
jgi:hypothetical protein